MNLLSRDAQISPDKNVNFPCTNAAFTLSPEPVGFVVLCQLARRLSLLCGFCSSSRTFALRLPSDLSSRRRHCLRLVLLIVFLIMNTFRFSYRGLAPHKFTPMPGVHISLVQMQKDALHSLSVPPLRFAPFISIENLHCCTLLNHVCLEVKRRPAMSKPTALNLEPPAMKVCPGISHRRKRAR